ncbi:MAG: hypothetical protein FWE08_04870 [Oscillospiraceae bacterium]|nr:hypothetical protein [Oscillospiraceae bacterium]
MERNIGAFKIWAPRSSHWSQWAKPILFVGAKKACEQKQSAEPAKIPSEIADALDKKTAMIVDLPGKSGVLTGLGLATKGYRPVPLYNGIHEEKIGTLTPILDNTEIVTALLSGAKYLAELYVATDAPPVFLLDCNREKSCDESDELFDNRWSIDIEDMPSAEEFLQHGIDRLIIWTDGKTNIWLNEDLTPILSMYKDKGIQVFLYRGDRLGERLFEYRGAVSESPRPVRFHSPRFRWRLFRRRGFRIRWDRTTDAVKRICGVDGYKGTSGYSNGKPGYKGSNSYSGSKPGYKGYGGYGGKGSGGYSGKGYSGFRGGYGGGCGG